MVQFAEAFPYVAAITAIAKLTADTTLDPSAWFDDDCTVAQTAILVLKDPQALDNAGT
jgi:hypothetical protein